MAYLEMVDIVKRYPGVLANDQVSLELERGEIHAVMGENGAGKSTLMSILYGLQSPDEGYIRLKGSTLFLQSPLDAIAHGIGMVHQAFKLFESLSVWENVVYRREPRRGIFIDAARARAQVEELAHRHGLPIDPRARVANLPVGVRQRLEILKALYREAEVLILDEPTAPGGGRLHHSARDAQAERSHGGE
jgi:simple sugar transport system ATP-binding protein